MTYRTVICVLLVGVSGVALACGRATEEDDPPTRLVEPPFASLEVPFEPTPNSLVSQEEPEPFYEQSAPSSSKIYRGATTLEERMLNADAIVRAELISFRAVAEQVRLSPLAEPDVWTYEAVLEFRFLVLEWIVGSGSNEITVVVPIFGVEKTQAQAESILPMIAELHDTRWDERDAILFLKNSHITLLSTDRADRFFLTIYDVAHPYSIESRWDKLWLPAAQVHSFLSPGEFFTAATVNNMEFLLDEPRPVTEADLRLPAVGYPVPVEHAPKITLGDFKTKVVELRAEMNAGGTEDHKRCVVSKYERQRFFAHLLDTNPDWEYDGSNLSPPNTHSFESGMAAGSVVHEEDIATRPFLPDIPDEVWIDSFDADLFSADPLSFTRRVTATRPLPNGMYTFYFNHKVGVQQLCEGNSFRYKWTVNVTAPTGTLHELFFDPVTVGTTVAADATNGVLKPSSFTSANDVAATLNSITYGTTSTGSGQGGTVKVEVDPLTALAGHIVDIIELDGTVSLSLDVSDATVDSANDTLSWSVASQPWEDGDLLMVRIREAPPEPVFESSSYTFDAAEDASVGSYRPDFSSAKLREGITTIAPRGRALQGVGLSSLRFHPIGGEPGDDKDGQEAWFTARNASLG